MTKEVEQERCFMIQDFYATQHQQKKLDIISQATMNNNNLIQDISWKTQLLFDDHSEAERQIEHVCKTCSYIRRKWLSKKNHILGYAEWKKSSRHSKAPYEATKCAFCGKEIESMENDRSSPILCIQCSDKYHVCRFCAGKLD